MKATLLKVACLLLALPGASAAAETPTTVTTANPATEYCEQVGGRPETMTDASGGQAGTCVLPEGQVCDQWALYRGECGATGTIEDPFLYCHTFGNTGIIAEQQTGEKVMDALMVAMIRNDLLPAEPLPEARKPFRWRCMEGQVWVCLPGANLPCGEKADVSREPAAKLVEFCRANPGSNVVPAYVTGRSTVYSWVCQDSTPTVDEQLFTADAAGYLAEFWQQLLPLAEPR